MKMKNILFPLLLLVVIACQDKEVSPILDNDKLLFTNSLPLLVDLSFDSLNLPFFSLENSSNKLIYLAISEEALTTKNREIQNQDAIIWQWHSGMNSNEIIQLGEGDFSDTIRFENSNIICGLRQFENLYWSAWAWNAEGKIITHSTESKKLNLVNQQRDNFSIEKVSTSDNDGDTYLKAGEQITYKITLDYSGDFPFDDLVATLIAPNIVELPITIQVEGTISDKVDLSYTFSLPEDALFKEAIPLLLNLKYNECFEEELDLSVATTGRDVCLKSMTLKKIYTNPPQGQDYWDDICGFIPYLVQYRNPDPCYTLGTRKK